MINYPRISGHQNWVSALKPYYQVDAIVKCPADGFFAHHSFLINGFNDFFAVKLSKEQFDVYKQWQWPVGMRMAHIPEPSNTITFGEKRKSSYHAHMDFYQGDGNDVQEIDQAKHGARREGEGGGKCRFCRWKCAFHERRNHAQPRKPLGRYRSMASCSAAREGLDHALMPLGGLTIDLPSFDEQTFLHAIPLSILSAWIAVLMVPVIDASPRMYAAQETGQKPHVVLILADDLGWSILPVMGAICMKPLIWMLWQRMVFVLPMPMRQARCALPLRASLLTGRHPARLDMTIWRESAKKSRQPLPSEPITRDALPLSEKTLAEYLKQAGYYTAHVGKWHLGPAESYPQPHGFDVNIGGTLWGHLRVFSIPTRGLGIFRAGDTYLDLEPGEPGDYLTDKLTEKAMEVLDQKADHQPVFLNLWAPFGSYAYRWSTGKGGNTVVRFAKCSPPGTGTLTMRRWLRAWMKMWVAC